MPVRRHRRLDTLQEPIRLIDPADNECRPPHNRVIQDLVENILIVMDEAARWEQPEVEGVGVAALVDELLLQLVLQFGPPLWGGRDEWCRSRTPVGVRGSDIDQPRPPAKATKPK